ncbi:MAG: glutamine--tRNA ligase/YqeY domain fusion protein [Flavobacteriaceae bacterium]
MEQKSLNFIEHIIEEDLKLGMSPKALRFRFPPEPNGFLHIGHVKAICLNFNLGVRYQAPVNLRFDDTNPATEESQFVQAIQEDIQWLGYQWDSICYASDYFDQLYQWAEQLIQKNLAYVDSQGSENIAQQKGSPTQAGTASPFRDRSVEENLSLFREMRAGKHPEGSHVLRAKIDMSSPNMLLRDPIMYRIMFKTHHRTGDDWCIYPMYDWTHGQSDYKEQISHSLCSLEFKPHRDLYEWFLEALQLEQGMLPKQREFARLNLAYTVTSKRKLKELIDKNLVTGWDDPRMPTIAGLRRRGYTPESLRNFVDTVGVAKRENLIDMALLEHSVREDLNYVAPRVNAVLNPVKLTIANYPENQKESLQGEINPEQPDLGTREIPFSRTLYIEREDFKEEVNRKFFRLTLGKEVRLKNAYIIKGERVIKNSSGEITEIICSYDPDSKSGSGTEASQRKVKGTLHWVSAADSLTAEVHLYDRLYSAPSPDKGEGSHLDHFNHNSHQVVTAFVEPSLNHVKPGTCFQFQRLGYFTVDSNSTDEKLVFNKTVGLRDSWAKLQQD